MRNLETYVNEKLRVTKSIATPSLIALAESKDLKDYVRKEIEKWDRLQ